MVRRVLLSRVTRQSRKGILPFSSISLLNWMLVFCLFKCSWNSSASILRYHLALIVPDEVKQSRITVNGVNIPWREGKGILFDDTFEHSASNGAEEDRLVLIEDIFRPNLGLVDLWIQTLEVWKRTRDFHAGRAVMD